MGERGQGVVVEAKREGLDSRDRLGGLGLMDDAGAGRELDAELRARPIQQRAPLVLLAQDQRLGGFCEIAEEV